MDSNRDDDFVSETPVSIIRQFVKERAPASGTSIHALRRGVSLKGFCGNGTRILPELIMSSRKVLISGIWGKTRLFDVQQDVIADIPSAESLDALPGIRSGSLIACCNAGQF